MVIDGPECSGPTDKINKPMNKKKKATNQRLAFSSLYGLSVPSITIAGEESEKEKARSAKAGTSSKVGVAEIVEIYSRLLHDHDPMTGQ